MESVFEIKAKGEKQYAAALDLVNKKLEQTKKQTTDLKKTGNLFADPNLKKAQENLGKVNKELKETQTLQNKLLKQMKEAKDFDAYFKLEKEAKAAETRVLRLTEAQEVLNRRIKEMSQNVSRGGGLTMTLGNVAMPFQRVGMAAGGSGVSGEIGRAIGDIGDIAESVGMLSREFKQLAPQIKTAVTNLKNTGRNLFNIARGAKQSQGGLGGLVQGLGSFNVLSALAVGNMLVWGKALELHNSAVQREIEAQGRRTEGLRRELELRQQIQDFIESGDLESAQQQLENAQAERERVLALIADKEAYIADLDRQYAALGHSLNIFERDRLRQLGDQAREDLAGLYQELEQPLMQVIGLMDSMPEIEDASEARIAMERLQDAERNLTNVRIQARDAAENFARQIRDFQDENLFQDARERREQQRADQRAERDHQEALKDIVRQGQKSIKDAYRDYQKERLQAEKQAGKEELRALKNLQKSEMEILKDYNKSYAESEERFRKESLKSQKAYERERFELERDLQDRLLDAELENNVVAFIQAERDANKQRRKAEEDRRLELQESEEAHREEMQQLREQAEERRAELHEQFREEQEERRQQRAEEEAERRAALQERILEIKQENAALLAETKARHAEERAQLQEDREWAAMLRREDRARQLKEMQEAFDREVAAMKEREDELLVVIESGGHQIVEEVTYQQLQVVNAYKEGAYQAVEAIRAAMSTMGGGYGSSNDSKAFGLSGSGRTFKFTAPGTSRRTYTSPGFRGVFADEGGVFKEPTLAILAERRPEVVVPMDRSGGLPNMGTSYKFDFSNMNVGSDISRREVQKNLEMMAKTLHMVLTAAKSGQSVSSLMAFMKQG